MPGEGDPRVGIPGATPYRWERPASQPPGDPGQASTPDLMSELRAATEEALSSSAGPETAAEASSEPVVQVPLVLLRRLVTTLTEARLALAQQHGRPAEEAAAAGAPAATDVDTARMVVLNMALNGASRAEAERYLARNFALSDPAAVVTDAYECVPEILSRLSPSGGGSEGRVDAPDDDRQAP